MRDRKADPASAVRLGLAKLVNEMPVVGNVTGVLNSKRHRVKSCNPFSGRLHQRRRKASQAKPDPKGSELSR